MTWRPEDDDRVGRHWLAAVFLAALAYRGVCFACMGDHPLLSHPVVDAAYHDQVARRVAAGNLLGHGPDDVFKPPVYGYFLAGLYAVLGRNIPRVQWVQYLLGATSVVLLAVLAGRLAGRWAGRVAGLMGALYAPFVFFESQLLATVLTITLNAAFLLMLLRLCGRSTRPGLLITGVLIGLSAGVRPDVLLPAALVVLAVAWRGWEVPWAKRATRLALVLAGTAASILPITLRNYELTGQLIPVASYAGINLYTGNVAGDGLSPVPVGLRWERLVSRVPQNVLENPRAADRWWTHETWKGVHADVRGWLGRLRRKLLGFLGAREFRNNIDYHFMQRRAWVLRWPFPQYALVLPLAVVGLAGLWRSGKRANRLAALLCILWTTGYWFVSSVFFLSARFRLPVVPVLLIPAGWAVVQLVESLRRRRRKPLLPAAIVFLGTAALCWPNWLGPPESRWTRDYVNLGTSLQAAQDPDAAGQAYRQALVHDREDPDANYLLGRMLLPRDPEAALRHFRTASRVLGDSPDVLLAIAEGCMAVGQSGQATEALRRVVKLSDECNLWPRRQAWAAAHIRLAELEPHAAEKHWREAWRVDPRTAAEASLLKGRNTDRVLATFGRESLDKPWDWYAQANYGLALLRSGRADEAVGVFRRAARLSPERPMLRLQLARALLTSGRKPEAAEVLREVLRDLPEGPLRRQARELLTRVTTPTPQPH